MTTSSTIIKYLLVGLVVLILGGLSGWFFYLRSQTSLTTQIGQSRGYGISTPLFGSPEGSTQSDIAQSLGEGGGAQGTSASSQLWRVDATPVAGFGFQQAASSTPGADLYFAERGDGNIFQGNFATHSVVRITDTLMPKVYQAYFAPGGGTIERSVNSQGIVTTFQGQIKATNASSTTSTSTPEELDGADIASGITQLSLDPANGSFAYLVTGQNGYTDLIQQPWTITTKTKSKQLLSSAIGSWQLFALSDGRVIMLEAPADNVEGYAYTISSAGALTQLASGPGLTVSPDPGSTALIFGTSQNGTLTLYSQESPKSAPVPLGLATIANKCAWLPGESMIAYCAVPETVPSQTFLDDWYKGAVHTSDSWYQVDASTGSTTLVYAPQQGAAPLDVQDPGMDPSGTYVVFLNAIDESLWALNVSQ